MSARLPVRSGRRLPAALLCLIGALAVAGCGSHDPPTVRFTAAAGAATAGPTQYCDVAVTGCTAHPEAPVKLAVEAGTALRVSVPDAVASTPWQVVFSYAPAGGGQVDGRSRVFAPGTTRDYELVLPAPTDHLVTAQVQQFGGAAPAIGPDGVLSFPIRGSWVLNTG